MSNSTLVNSGAKDQCSKYNLRVSFVDGEDSDLEHQD